MILCEYFHVLVYFKINKNIMTLRDDKIVNTKKAIICVHGLLLTPANEGTTKLDQALTTYNVVSTFT